jgi:hypothetical protein
MRRLLLVAASVALLSTPVAAQPPISYLCEVGNVYELSFTGEVQQTYGGIGRRGDRFQINVNTGEMTGEKPIFSSGSWAKTSVIDPGTNPMLDPGTRAESFLKVMYSSPIDAEVMNFGYLVIQGKVQQPSRPFLYQVGPELYSGTCRAAEPEHGTDGR